MKRFFTAMLSVAFGLLISCEEDITPATVSSAPTAQLTSPAAINAGSNTAITVRVRDGVVSPLASGTITLKRGATVISTNSAELSGQEATLTIQGAVVAPLTPGAYKVEVTVTDTEEQTTNFSADVVISCQAPASCVQTGKVTVILIAPSPGASSIGLVGEINNWGGSADIPMTPIPGATGCYCAAVSLSADANDFKFRLDSDWGKEELNATCQPTSNRTYTSGSTTVQTVTAWKTVAPCAG